MHSLDIRIGQNQISVLDLYEKIRTFQIVIDLGSSKWNKINMSRSIESIFLGLTMTPIYLDATNPKQWIVLDGKKRLHSIVEFLKNDGFILEGLEFFTELNGNNFDNLPVSLKRKIYQSYFSIFTINQGLDSITRKIVIYRIVPDLKKGFGEKLFKSFFNEKTNSFLSDLEQDSFYTDLLKQYKIEINSKIVYPFLINYFNKRGDIKYSLKRKEDLIDILINISIEEIIQIKGCWNKLVLETKNFFENTNEVIINKTILDFFIILFLKEDSMFFNLKRNKDLFLKMWRNKLMDNKNYKRALSQRNIKELLKEFMNDR